MFNVRKKLNLNNVYKIVSQFEIIQRIIPNASLTRHFAIRDENDCSTCITESRGNLYIKDFGDAGQVKGESWINYLIRINSWEGDKKGFIQALDWVNNEFNLGLETANLGNSFKKASNNTKPKLSISTSYKKPVKLEIKSKPWTKAGLEYWFKFGITKEELESKNIVQLKCYWITNPNKSNTKVKIDCNNELCFAYSYYKDADGIFMYKIYTPLSNKYKWLSNCKSYVVENSRFITTPRKNCMIQSSLKDIMVLEYFRNTYGVFKDYDFIAPIAEGIWFIEKWDIIRATYSNIVYYGNNDYNKKNNSGLNYARNWSLLYNIPFIINPYWAKSSDISDYRRDTSEEDTFKLLKIMETQLKYIL